jgi:hypothetical protein
VRLVSGPSRLFASLRFASTPLRGAHGLDGASVSPVLGNYVMAGNLQAFIHVSRHRVEPFLLGRLPVHEYLSTDGVDAVQPVTAVTNICELSSFAVW